MNIKTTTKRGIRQIFSKITHKQWERFFSREKENGLYLARETTVAAKTGMPAQCIRQYDIETIAKWVIDHGYYSLKEIEEVLG